MRVLTSFLVVIGALAFAATQASAVDITECGQEVPPLQVGNLVGDLDCSDPNQFVGDAVELDRAATLNLNGFSLIGPEGSYRQGVDCRSRCRVNGPGAIVGFYEGVTGGSRVEVSDVNITGARRYGIVAQFPIVKRCTISEVRGAGIGGRIGPRGIHGRVRVIDSSIIDNLGDGIIARRLMLRNVIVSGNAEHGCTSGHGLRPPVLRARDSTIVGNGIDCPPDKNGCCDIKNYKRRMLRNTVIGSEWRGGECIEF
jgi:hypothetical protein